MAFGIKIYQRETDLKDNNNIISHPLYIHFLTNTLSIYFFNDKYSSMNKLLLFTK